MKLKLMLLMIVVSSFVSTVFAEDTCTADISKYTQEGLKNRKPIFDGKDKAVSKIFPSKLRQYGFEDRISLKNGTDVVYTTGGCAHYGYSFTFKGKEITSIKKSEKLDRAELLLKNIRLIDDSEKDLLLRAFSEAKKKKLVELTDNEFQLPCGDANCTMVDRGDQEVSISYDFAL